MTLAASTTRTVRPRHQCGGRRRLLPRILLAKLVALFFIVHPGSCATFNSRKFLTQRYPNRDVIPACLLHQQQQQQQRRRDATNVLAGAPAAAGSSSSSPLFIRTPAISPCSSSSSRMTPRSFAPQVARPVVIGSFVSELESSNMDRRRNGVKHQLQQQASQLLSSNLFQSSNNNNNNNKAPATGITTRKMTSVHSGATSSSSSSLNMGGLFQKSAATMVDVYDGVLSFVGSRIVTTEMTFNKAFSAVSSSMVAPLAATMEGEEQEARRRSNNSQPQLSVRPTGGSSGSSFGPPLSSSFSTSSLVGYLDVDPFEKSKKHFKRNTSLAKLLL